MIKLYRCEHCKRWINRSLRQEDGGHGRRDALVKFGDKGPPDFTSKLVRDACPGPVVESSWDSRPFEGRREIVAALVRELDDAAIDDDGRLVVFADEAAWAITISSIEQADVGSIEGVTPRQ